MIFPILTPLRSGGSGSGRWHEIVYKGEVYTIFSDFVSHNSTKLIQGWVPPFDAPWLWFGSQESRIKRAVRRLEGKVAKYRKTMSRLDNWKE